MRACLAIALLFSLGVCGAYASPFDQVPIGDAAYADCAFLADCGIIVSRPADDFAGASPLTRYDFTMSLVSPMTALEALARDGRSASALDSPRYNDGERARVGQTLARLLDEFRDVLAMLGKDVTQALQGARLLSATAPAGAATSDNRAGVTYEGARTRLDVIYHTGQGEGAALPHIPLGGLPDAPIIGLAAAPAPASRAAPSQPELLTFTDVSLRRLHGSVEYGVTDDLTLRLAYDSMVREGRGTEALDTASLRTLGVGYRLSPSTSVKLSYHLINYTDRVSPATRLSDRMAETELIVRF